MRGAKPPTLQTPNPNRLRQLGFGVFRYPPNGGAAPVTPPHQPTGISLRKLSLLALILTLTSCATTVRFQVERAPLVDLRGLPRITVIPLEQSSLREHRNLAAFVTEALADGIRGNVPRSGLLFVEPASLSRVPRRELAGHVDAFLIGRITEARPNVVVQESTRTVRGQELRVNTVTMTVSVSVEYSYVRAADGRELAVFRKTESFEDTASFLRNPRGAWDWNNPLQQNRTGRWGSPGWFDPRHLETGARRRGRDDLFRPGSWGESVARSAIDRFSQSMDRELAPWTGTEQRSLRPPGRDADLAEARDLVRMGRRDRALELYLRIHGETGNVSAGFNAAILLAAEESFAEALSLLESIRREALAAGRDSPAFVRREIRRMTEIVDGLALLGR
ncbi:MAG: hypothetical protein FWD94_04415 [Treponema sp.]|nr:hypothetical protein [Treponema sp.]